MKTFFFYIVYNNEIIVGRYDGATILIDALSHLRLYGKMRTHSREEGFPNNTISLPLSNSSPSPSITSDMANTRRSFDDRALIPVIDNHICHPFVLLSFHTVQDILRLYDENDLNTESMFESTHRTWLIRWYV